jgi:hypothetical protein
MKIKDLVGFNPKELIEARPYGDYFDDSGISARPGHDEGEPVYDPRYDRIGAGDPRPYRNRQYQQQADVPHDVHINGKKWKTFGSHSHATNVARKIKGATVHRSLGESASAGATSAANIGTVVSPQLSPGKARGKKSYTGSVSSGSGTKAPPQPKVVQPKNSDGTAKNGLDMGNVFGGATIKR